VETLIGELEIQQDVDIKGYRATFDQVNSEHKDLVHKLGNLIARKANNLKEDFSKRMGIMMV